MICRFFFGKKKKITAKARDLKCVPNDNGDLTEWARQGVMLLNTSLTVRENKPGSHLGVGWRELTKRVIHRIDKECEHIIFLLWGVYAQEYEHLLTKKRHYILKSGHPSAMNKTKDFVGCNHFSRCNTLLINHGQQPIHWTTTKK